MKNRNWKKIIKISLVSVLVLFLVAVITILTASGVFSNPRYLEPWDQSYSDKFNDPRIKLAAHGLLAANSHNMQPWNIKLDSDDNVFYLFADSERTVEEVDPYARQHMVTQGTFLEYVRVAGEKMGYNTDITLFPDGQYDEKNLEESMNTKPVAKIEITKTKPKSVDLYDYMFLQDTNRAAYKRTELTPGQIQQLLATNNDREMKLEIFQDKENTEKLGNYALEGAKIESEIHRIYQLTAEVFRSNEYQKNKYRYGFSLEGQGSTTGVMKHVIQGLITLFPSMNNEQAAADIYVQSTQTQVDNTPAYAILTTKDNSRMEQVKSGMIYSRMVLTAHTLGLVMQPTSQVLQEYAEMAEQYTSFHKDYAPNGGTVQMFIRIGQPTQEFPISMRRDVMDLVVK